MIRFYRQLTMGKWQQWAFEGDASGTMLTTTPVSPDAPQAMWLMKPQGRINLPRSRKVEFLNWVVDEVAAWALQLGLKELRIESPRGNKWHRLLRGFVLMDDNGSTIMIRKI